MPLPLVDFNKRPVVFVDALSPMLADLYRAFDVQFVLTSNIVTGRERGEVASALVQAGFPLVVQHLHAEWVTPKDADSRLDKEIDAWHATAADQTPTAYLIVASNERGSTLGHILREYVVMVDDFYFSSTDYISGCRVLHTQTSFGPFNADWY